MPRLDADDRQACLGQPAEEPLRKRPRLEPDPVEPPSGILQKTLNILGMAGNLDLAADLARLIDDAHGCLFQRDI